MLETWIFDRSGTRRSHVPMLYPLDIYQKKHTRFNTPLNGVADVKGNVATNKKPVLWAKQIKRIELKGALRRCNRNWEA